MNWWICDVAEDQILNILLKEHVYFVLVMGNLLGL